MMTGVDPTAATAPTVSVIVPCRNEAHHVAACLDSLLASDYPRDHLEVLVVEGMSNDGTRDVVAGYARRHPMIRLVDNPRGITPAALNIGIRAARGQVLIRADARVLYPPHYIRHLVTALEHSSADNVGGVLATIPAGDGPMARAIAAALAHPFGVGNSYFRIGVTEQRWVDTVAFFCCRRETFDRVGGFDEALVRGQDDEFNARILAHGGRILLVPDVVARYYARATLRQVARMFYQYGYFKPLVARKIGRITSVRQLVPAAFVASLAGSVLLAPWIAAAAWLAAAIAMTYGAVVLGATVVALPRLGVRTGIMLAAVFPVLHVSYGVGFLRRAAALAIQPGRRVHQTTDLPLSH